MISLMMPGILFLLITLFAPMARAENKLESIVPGMSMSEVLVAAGPAQEKVIKEVKHEEDWLYPGYSLRFHDGIVIELPLALDIASDAAASSKKVKAEVKNERGVHKKPDSSKDMLPQENFKEVLKEVLKEGPSDDSGLDKSMGKSAGNQVQSSALQGMPSIPSGNMGDRPVSNNVDADEE
jgi:hypothetical protein